MILNYQLSNEGENIMSYHVVNVLLHLSSVLLLFTLFKKLNIKELHAFILCLVFAVHPVLSEAVAWIPGRNDTLLTVFTLSYLLFAIQYTNEGKLKWLLLSVLALILAFFTKETAVFIAPTAFILLVFILKRNWKEPKMLAQYGVWAGCFGLWYIARSMATLQAMQVAPIQMLTDFAHRLPLVVQYTGKMFLPFNLSVFPILEDTVYYYGCAAVVMLALIIYLAKDRDKRVLLSGFAIFLLFLLPILLIPKSLNEQTFEHRLYLPFLGMLLVISQTALFKNRLSDKNLLIGGLCACGVLAGINFYHQRNFKDPISFWTQAEETSPHSAFAVMMYAARLTQKEDFPRACSLMRRAYALNPKEKYLNFYMGQMLQNKDSVLASEPYLLEEKKISDYVLCDFLLARVAMEKKDYPASISYLESYLQRDKYNKMAHSNLMLLYIQTQQRDKAIAHAKLMRNEGIEVPTQFLQQLGIR